MSANRKPLTRTTTTITTTTTTMTMTITATTTTTTATSTTTSTTITSTTSTTTTRLAAGTMATANDIGSEKEDERDAANTGGNNGQQQEDNVKVDLEGFVPPTVEEDQMMSTSSIRDSNDLQGDEEKENEVQFSKELSSDESQDESRLKTSTEVNDEDSVGDAQMEEIDLEDFIPTSTETINSESAILESSSPDNGSGEVTTVATANNEQETAMKESEESISSISAEKAISTQDSEEKSGTKMDTFEVEDLEDFIPSTTEQFGSTVDFA